MAEVTYYWDVWGLAPGWYDADNAVDGLLTTFAYCSADSYYIKVNSTTSDGTDLGTITKVEIRVYGYGDGNDRIDISFGGSPITPDYQLTMPTSENWSIYVDVTDDPNVNGWTWAKIDNLMAEMSKGCVLEYDKVGKANTMYCAKVEIRVTYTPSGPEPEKVTQYLSGKDCPAFPHEMDLQSDKLPCPPPY